MTQTTNPLGRFGRFGTSAIAYLSLAVGAGLSTAFNVVHTIETRGALLGPMDIVVAVAGPGMVILMVELFVSTLWAGQRWYMQAIRWVGCLMVAGIAMRMSWTHGHAFLVSRGQTGDVSALMPLAVDTLAIMATALLLSSRMSQRVRDTAGRDTDSMDKPGTADTAGQDKPQYFATEADTYTDTEMMSWTRPDTDKPVPDAEMSIGQARDILDAASMDMGHVDTPTAGQLEDMFSLSDFLPQPSGPVPSPLPVPVSSPPAPGRKVVRTIAPTEMGDMVSELLAAGVTPSAVKVGVAEVYGVSTKTVGRRIQALTEA